MISIANQMVGFTRYKDKIEIQNQGPFQLIQYHIYIVLNCIVLPLLKCPFNSFNYHI